jgi:hypothetical protein
VDKIPFSVYDFFGHLSAGVLLLATVAVALEGSGALDIELTLAQAVTLTVAAYVIGHVVASFSSFILERRLTRQLLGVPTERLFASDDPQGWQKLVAGYFVPLPKEVAERVIAKSEKKAHISQPGEALFYHCFAVVRQHEYPRERLATFLNLYGFSRNMAFAALVATVILVLAAVTETAPDSHYFWGGAIGALVVAVVLYLRYLKFYRHYSLELYVTYSEID